MTAKRWQWRAKTSALYISTQIPHDHSYKILFCSSVLPLALLVGLRPDLARLHKIVYFHDNQLEFKSCDGKERDFQYGFNEILTCIAADQVLFNSQYNCNTFLSGISSHLKLQPDYKMQPGLDLLIKTKTAVVYYPLDLITIDNHLISMKKEDCNILHIVWPHKWEFDKNPGAFYRVICKLNDHGYEFKVSLLGESFNKKPEIFCKLMHRLGSSRLQHCGYVENTKEYYRVLRNADVVVSTAIREFFGTAILEAVYCGCIPIVPKRLSYKELFEEEVEEIYDTEDELFDVLVCLCKRKKVGKINKSYKHLALQFNTYKWFPEFLEMLRI